MSSYAGTARELLLRYDEPGPRYTSYPTAPTWTDAFGPQDWRHALERANRNAAAPLSLYVHLPYCHSLCLFCGCSVLVTRDPAKARSYVDVVLEEARLLAEALPDRRGVGQHHWGGGTPTFLPPAELVRLYRGISRLFPPLADAEVSVEVDPRTTTLEQLEVLREIGFNRLSMGIQDFTPRVQETIHRIQSSEQTEELFQGARRLGFASINVDLVYGLPFQEVETFGKTLDTVIAWGADRFACYSYAHVPWMKKHQQAIPEDALPDRNAKFALLELALQRFEAAGYEAIGFDHFAKSTDTLARAAREQRLHRNFQGYTTRMAGGRAAEDMIALGITAIGEVAGAFGQNHKIRKDWESRIRGGGLATARGYRRNAEDEERRRIILDLMCSYGVDFADHEDDARPPFAVRYRDAIERLRPMQDDGLVRIGPEDLRVTETGRLFLRNICMPFDAYLQTQRDQQKPVFSRTV